MTPPQAPQATARPWDNGPTGPVMRDKYSQPFGISAEYEPGHHTMIAGIFGDVHGGPDVAKANAALIVAAVNSHDAALRLAEAVLALADNKAHDMTLVAELARAFREAAMKG